MQHQIKQPITAQNARSPRRTNLEDIEEDILGANRINLGDRPHVSENNVFDPMNGNLRGENFGESHISMVQKIHRSPNVVVDIESNFGDSMTNKTVVRG